MSGGDFRQSDELSNPPFAHFQTLEKQRKRRMSWIPKSAGSIDSHLGSRELPGDGGDPGLSVDQIQEELPSPVVAHLTRAEKSKARKEAEDFQETGMTLGIGQAVFPVFHVWLLFFDVFCKLIMFSVLILWKWCPCVCALVHFRSVVSFHAQAFAF